MSFNLVYTATIMASCFLAGCSGSAKMISPLKGGYIITNDATVLNLRYNNWNLNTIYPTDNYQVRAAEDGKVISIFTVDGDFAIVIKGHRHYVTYNGFDSCYVQQNALVKKGQSIGRLAKDEGHGLDFLITDKRGKTHSPNISFPTRKAQ